MLTRREMSQPCSPDQPVGVARGSSGCTCTPKGGKFFRRNLQGKFVSVPLAHQLHPQAEQESIFRTFGREWFILVVFRPSFEIDEQKKVVNFFDETSAAQTKSWLRLWRSPDI